MIQSTSHNYKSRTQLGIIFSYLIGKINSDNIHLEEDVGQPAPLYIVDGRVNYYNFLEKQFCMVFAYFEYANLMFACSVTHEFHFLARKTYI